MTDLEYIVAGCTIALLLILGIVLYSGHGAWLIAGFNTLPRKERERYDKRALCRFMGKFLFVATGAVLLICASEIWPGYGLFTSGLTILLSSVVYVLIRANTKDRFLKK